MAKILKVEPRTEAFLKALDRLKELNKLPSNIELARVLDIASPATITEIKGRRQNIQPEAWEKFRKEYDKEISLTEGDANETTVRELPADRWGNDFKHKYYDLLERNNQVFTDMYETFKKQTEIIHMLATEKAKQSLLPDSPQDPNNGS